MPSMSARCTGGSPASPAALLAPACNILHTAHPIVWMYRCRDKLYSFNSAIHGNMSTLEEFKGRAGIMFDMYQVRGGAGGRAELLCLAHH